MSAHRCALTPTRITADRQFPQTYNRTTTPTTTRARSSLSAGSKTRSACIVRSGHRHSNEHVSWLQRHVLRSGRLADRHVLLASASSTEPTESEPSNEEELEAMEKKSRKKSSGKKDPNKPKRGKSAYLFFCDDNRAKVKEEMGDGTKVTEVTAELGRLWNELKESDKKEDKKKMEKYEKQAKEDKERYETEMADYEPPNEEELEEKKEKKKPAKKSSKKSEEADEVIEEPIEDEDEDEIAEMEELRKKMAAEKAKEAEFKLAAGYEFDKAQALWTSVRRELLSIGKSGVTDKHCNSLKELLAAHGVVKVKLNHDSLDTAAAVSKLEQTDGITFVMSKRKIFLFERK